MPQKRQKYNITFTVIAISQYIESNCSDINFINNGSIDVLLNGFRLIAGASLSFTAQFNELDTTKYLLSFDTDQTSGQAQPGQQVTIIRKIYV